MSRRARGRDLSGVVVLDKPIGMGSNEVLQVVKTLFRARKAGHTGSLDRQASGLLPICMGEATKLSGFLLNADKHYRSTFRLGSRTTTGDVEGEVVQTRPVGSISAGRVEEVLGSFRGEIQQIPPMYSAVKHKGERLYRLAHQGLVVEREPRTVTIFALTLRGFADDRLDVDVHCSKGTYIRTLAEDIGEALGCGAHVEGLRRTGSGPFHESDLVELDELRERAQRGDTALDEVLLAPEAALAQWPAVDLPEAVAWYLGKGQLVLVPHAPTEGWVRIHGPGRTFLGVGEVLDDGRIAPRRMLRQGGRKRPAPQ